MVLTIQDFNIITSGQTRANQIKFSKFFEEWDNKIMFYIRYIDTCDKYTTFKYFMYSNTYDCIKMIVIFHLFLLYL